MEPSPPEASSSTDKNFSSSILLIVVVVLAVVFFVSGLLHVLLRCLLRAPAYREEYDDDADDADANVTAMQGRLQQLFRLHDSGVDQSFIDALPVFPYGAIAGPGDPFDCAVCLCEFEPDDRLRLLTGCSHAFHVGCIDTWLLAHSTCPLCRSSLLCQSSACGVGSACESSRLSAASSVSALVLGEDDDKLVEESNSEAKEELVEVRLGKFRRNNIVDAGGSVDRNDQRRCFSMGSYEYIMNESSSSLPVALKPSKRRQLAMSECDCHSKRQLGFLKLGFDHEPSKKRSIAGSSKRESFSVSKIWLRREPRPPPTNGAESSRRAVSFRLPPPSRHEPEASAKSPVERRGESETEAAAGSCCSNSVVSMESQIGETPSFARRTLQWIVNKNNRVGSHVV